MKFLTSKWLFNLLIYISFVFLFIYFIKTDFIDLSTLDVRFLPLAISVVLFWIGITLSSISWWNALRVHGLLIKPSTAIISHGLSIFAKYIPGKIWVILGRASYVSDNQNSLKIASVASLKEQLIYVWTGIGTSIFPVLIYYGFNRFSILVFSIFLLLTIFLFFSPFHNFVLVVIHKLFKKTINIPSLDFKKNISIIGFCMLYWSIWMVGFYFLSIAIYSQSPVTVMFAFPLGVTIGLIAIIIPSGLGVREGVISGYLILTGIPEEVSVTIAFLARFWFLSGEVYIFSLSMLLKFIEKKRRIL